MNGRLMVAQRQIATATLAGLAPRAAVVLFGVAGIVLAAPARVLLVLIVLALLLSAATPEQIAAAPPALLLVVGWMIEQGSSVAAPGPRAVAFALAVYLLTSAGGLAAAIPVNAAVDPIVFIRWTRRLVVPCVAAVAVGAILAVPGRLPGSTVLDVVGLLGAIGVLVVVVRAVDRR